ncbi:hypothetical protein BASA81_006768 [Batrachochytrium salamandrivorans]|nr:hypothetical protein BASA81_006768 [Batrachochytrium salamandrivorans]
MIAALWLILCLGQPGWGLFCEVRTAVDLVWVVDSSMDALSMQSITEFLGDFSTTALVSQHSRVGLVQFSTELGKIVPLQAPIEANLTVETMGGYRSSGMALQYIEDVVFAAESGAGQNVRVVVLLLAGLPTNVNGITNDSIKLVTQNTAASLRASGVELVLVTIPSNGQFLQPRASFTYTAPQKILYTQIGESLASQDFMCGFDAYLPPTETPTLVPTVSPTAMPTKIPTKMPTKVPTKMPTKVPIVAPTTSPTEAPNTAPTASPNVLEPESSSPTISPNAEPSSGAPTAQPTSLPTAQPTSLPTVQPTSVPTFVPTMKPAVESTAVPTAQPTVHPTTQPTAYPTVLPTLLPVTVEPTPLPTTLKPVPLQPTKKVTRAPTKRPTPRVTLQPTKKATLAPTKRPTPRVTLQPVKKATLAPTKRPTPRVTLQPTKRPTLTPSKRPTPQETSRPTKRPTLTPTSKPTGQPTALPSRNPTPQFTLLPTLQPSSEPTHHPTRNPTLLPTSRPTLVPTQKPTNPTASPTKGIRKNVLMLISDDFKPLLPSYRSPYASQMTNLDKLGRESISFMNAHSQMTMCGPSRASFLTSLRPDTTRVYNLYANSLFQYIKKTKSSKEALVIPKLFKLDGYRTYGVGKVFHETEYNLFSDTSVWTEPMYSFVAGLVRPPVFSKPYQGAWIMQPEVADDFYADGQAANLSAKLIKDVLTNGEKAEPWFLAVGLWKPVSFFI